MEERKIVFRKYREMPTIDDLCLPTRAKTALQIEGIYNLVDLLKKPKEDLLRLRNFGTKSLKAIEDALKKYDIVWKPLSEYDETIFKVIVDERIQRTISQKLSSL